MSPTRRRRRPLRLHWAVALMLMPPPSPQVETGWRTRHRRCPPHLPCSFFLNGFAPPPPSFARGPVKGGGVACPLSFDSTFSSSLSSSSSSSWALTYYVVAIATSLYAPSPLSLRRRLYCRAAATIVAPMPVSLHLSRASGWLLHRHPSRCTSLFAPQSLSSPPLSLHYSSLFGS